MSKRYVIVLPFAAIATAGLFGLMTVLIRSEWSPQVKSEALKYEINPQIIDITVTRKNMRPDELKSIETPPAPPEIDTQARILPSTPIATVEGAIPDFDFKIIDMKTNVAINVDSEEKAILRLAPVMPTRAERSGHCIVRFDINAEGAPYNITTPHCSQSMFSRPTLKAVSGWKYRPAIQGGQAQSSRSIETRMTFNLADENGNIIPE